MLMEGLRLMRVLGNRYFYPGLEYRIVMKPAYAGFFGLGFWFSGDSFAVVLDFTGRDSF